MSSLQHTRLSRLQNRVGLHRSSVLRSLVGRSLQIIGLLMGFLLGSSLTEYLKSAVGLRTISALTTLIACELLVALRRRFLKTPMAFHWRLLDNLRLGFVYAVVLEAFKVGS